MKVTTALAKAAAFPYIIIALIFSANLGLSSAFQSAGQGNKDPRIASVGIGQFHNLSADSSQFLPTTTAASFEPRTSISVHTVVRNKPVFMPLNTESPLVYAQPPTRMGDNSYSYTYEDVSASEDVKSFSPTTTRATPRSFWNSQKALLDARKQQSAKKYPYGYHRQVGGSSNTTTSKPIIEFKKRERPKFGLNKKPFKPVTKAVNKVVEDKTEPSTSTTQIRSITAFTPTPQTQSSYKTVKASNPSSNFQNQIPTKSKVEATTTDQKQINKNTIGRVGELPLQQPYAVQTQAQYRQAQPEDYSRTRSNKFDQSVGNVHYVSNQNTVQQPIQQTNLNPRTGSIFIAASPPANGMRTASGQADSSIIQRLGSLGGGGGGGYGGGYGGGGGKPSSGFTVSLGSIPDPLTFLFRLLSLIPRPLLNLNGRLFFGVELGNNIGLVSGQGKTG